MTTPSPEAIEAAARVMQIAPLNEAGQHGVLMTALAAAYAVDMPTERELTAAIRSVTDLWDEPLDEVHDVPQIVNAILAARIAREESTDDR